jgi:uncharacterized protein (DUF362 family)
MMCDPHSSRREFLKRSLLGGTATLAVSHLAWARAAVAPVLNTPVSASDKPASRVALTAGNDRVNLAFKALEPFKKEVAAAIGGKRVILKPNNVQITGQLCSTHADNLEGILEFLKSIGKKDIVIAESAGDGPALEGFSNFGYNKFIGKYGVKLLDLDKEDFQMLHCVDEKDFRPHPIHVSKLLLDPNNFVISAAKFKTHRFIGATLSLKNIVVGAPLKGFGPDGKGSDKWTTHGNGLHAMNYNLFSLAARLHPHLAVIDGYEGMQGFGPVEGTPVDHRVCVASLDWLAADRVAVELMGMDFSKIGYLSYCAQAGTMGQADIDKIEIVGPALKDYIKKYELPKNWGEQLLWQQPMPPAPGNWKG